MRRTTGSTFFSPSWGATRKTNFFSSTPSSLKNDDRVWASGEALAPLAARTMSRTSSGDCSLSPGTTPSLGTSPTRIT